MMLNVVAVFLVLLRVVLNRARVIRVQEIVRAAPRVQEIVRAAVLCRVCCRAGPGPTTAWVKVDGGSP